MKTIKIKKLSNNAKIPIYATKGSACFDFYSCEDSQRKEIIPNKVYETIINTGLAMEIKKGFCVKIYPRSGWGFKYNISLANGTGIIDQDYRGEIKVKLIAFCTKENLPEIKKGTRIAQGSLEKVNKVKFIEAKKLSNTQRGTGGFGSTGEN